jgi:hypothetical protein
MTQSRLIWTSDETELLIAKYRSVKEGLAFYPLLYETFHYRTQSSIRSKVNNLVKSGVLSKKRHPSKRRWTPEELEVLDQLILQSKTLTQIAEKFKYRTLSSLEQKINSRPATKLVKQRKLQKINWSTFYTDGYVPIYPENWPRLRVANAKKSIFLVLERSVFRRKGYFRMAGFIRFLCKSAEREKKTRIAFYIVKTPREFINLALQKKVIRSAPQCYINTKNLIRASMLADGSMFCYKRKEFYYRFEICQAANYLGKTASKYISHAEYLLWFYCQLEPSVLTPSALSVVSGIKKRKDEAELTKAWKIRLSLYNLQFFKHVYKENYLNKKPSAFKQRRSIEITLIDRYQGQSFKTTQNKLKLDLKTKPKLVFKIDKHKLKKLKTKQSQKFKKKVKLKQLPQNNILKRYYFNNPGLTLAHLHMQDGSALKMSSTIKATSILHIQTLKTYDACRLAQVIFEETGIKYLPKTTYKKIAKRKKKVLLTTLILCPGSINKFVKLVNPFMLPPFNYKMIEAIDLKNPNNRNVIIRYEKAFNLFYAAFSQISRN